ncbi:MAG: ABC transporter permease [Candidatus Thorarchaeota archaeon]|jgi:hypothetical protein
MLLKELRLIMNDRYALILIFMLPGMIMGTMWVAIQQGSTGGMLGEGGAAKSSDAILLGLVDQDPSNTFPGEDLSENFTQYLQDSLDFIVVIFENEDDALVALYRDDVDAYAVLTYGFEGNITNDIPAFVEIHISSTNFMEQAAVFSAFSDVVAEFRRDHGWVKGEIEMDRVREFEPVGDYNAATFGVFLLVFSVFIGVAATAAQAIVGDIPLNRMLLTPATKMEAIISKTTGYFLVGMLQAQFMLILWMVMFGIRPNTDYLTLNIVCGLMSISGAALGVFISTLCKTRLQANQSFLFLLFSSFIVGTGFMDVGVIDDVWPLNMGRIMIFDTAFKGVPITTFGAEINLILVFSLFMLFLAWLVFARRKTLA